MKGRLTINFDPAYVCFESETNVRRIKRCSLEMIQELLLELHLVSNSYRLANNDFLANIFGDFPQDILAKYELAVPSELGLATKRRIDIAPSFAS